MAQGSWRTHSSRNNAQGKAASITRLSVVGAGNPHKTSRTTSHKRIYPGKEAGERLCEYLNSRPSKRVMNLLCDLRDAMQFGGSFVVWAQDPTPAKPGDRMQVRVIEEKTPENPLGYQVVERRVKQADVEKHLPKYGPKQRRKLWARIARTIRRYWFFPELEEWIKLWDKKRSLGRRMSWHWRSRNGPEGIAVLGILKLLEIGRLSRVRRCENCSKWFFSAVKEDGKFCSVKCQRAFSRAKEETREQHTEYMRVWRDRNEQEKANG